MGCTLPTNDRCFVAKHDGATPSSNIFPTLQNQSKVRRFVHVHEATSLRTRIEGFPREAIRVAKDSCGKYVWLDLETGAVFFWDHELDGSGEKIAESFEAFLGSLQPFDAMSVRLRSGQVMGAWIDPPFKPEFD